MKNKKRIAHIVVSGNGMEVRILDLTGTLQDRRFFPAPDNFRADAYSWAEAYPGVDGRIEVEEVR